MRLNRWWSDDPDEIYWLEITDRTNLGDDLNAPQRRDDGREFWGYSLINEISNGDIIFHYHKGDRAVVAWSRASGGVWDDTVLWGGHGTAARSAGVEPYLRPGWRHGLEDFNLLAAPLALADLRARESEFDDRGLHELKGIGRKRLYAVADSQTQTRVSLGSRWRALWQSAFDGVRRTGRR